MSDVTAAQSEPLPNHVHATSFPATYYGEFTMVDFWRPGNGNPCPSVQMRTRVSVKLTVTDAKQGKLSIRYFLYDHMDNVNATETNLIESPVLLTPPSPVTVSDPQSRDYFKFEWAVIQGTTARIKIYCNDRYTVVVDGTECHSAFTSSTYEGVLVQIQGKGAKPGSVVVLKT